MMIWVCGLFLVHFTLAFALAPTRLPTLPTTSLSATATFVTPDTSPIIEEACKDTAARMKQAIVNVSEDVHPEKQVGITYVRWEASQPWKSNVPVILIHGFDSSCLEYRRFGKKLAAQGIDTYAVDLLGWGFTQLQGVTSFSAQAKVEALNSWIETVVGKEKSFIIAGASLGGAAAIETAAQNPNCAGLVLIDAQGFVDGIGPMAKMPKLVANLGVQVLKSVPLRSMANQMSYFNKEAYATDDAVVVGRLHCLREGWNDALVSFMQSGGFAPSSKVPLIQAPSLVVWGRQDTILDGTEFAQKFVDTLPNARLQWIENCGHVPHLEQPDVLAETLASFVDEISPVAEESVSNNDAPKIRVTSNIGSQVWLAGAGATLAAALAADFLPVH